jgi:hypothetical protein
MCVRERERGAVMCERESGAGGLAWEVETPLPSNSSHDHMILRVDLVVAHTRAGNLPLGLSHESKPLRCIESSS